MKFAFLFLLLSFVACGYSVSPKVPELDGTVDASVDNIPAAYSTAAGSQVYSNLGGVTSVQVFNDTAEDVALYFAGTTCAGVVVDHVTVPAGVGWEDSNMAVNKVVCLRSKGAPIALGSVYIYAR